MSGSVPKSYQTVLNTLKAQKLPASTLVLNIDVKNDTTVEDSKNPPIEEYDTRDSVGLSDRMSLRLGQPMVRTSFIEKLDVAPFFARADEVKDSQLSPYNLDSVSVKPIHQHLSKSISLQERTDCLKMISATKGGSLRVTKKEKIELIFTPGRKSTRISLTNYVQRISLKVNEPLVLKMGNIKNEYEMHETIGVGSYGKVSRATCKVTKKEVAIKRIKKKKLSDLSRVLLENEIKILREINHDNIVKLFDVRDSGKYICLVLELCSGGDVFDWLNTEDHFDEVTAAWVLNQIVTGVAHLHGRGVVHRDIKLENLLIVWQDVANKKLPLVKLADFGFAITIKTPSSLIEGTCGSLNYVAPEVLVGIPYTKACDLWSVGVILYSMLAGYLPFYEDDNKGGRTETFRRIQDGMYNFDDPVWENVGDLARSVVCDLLTVDVATRLTCSQVLKHRWTISCVSAEKQLVGK